METFIAPAWKPVFAENGLGDFSAWWDLQAGWFEPRNERRGGWSGVSRLQLDLPEGGTAVVFLKRQQNHSRRTWRHPLRGEQTFSGELRNIRHLQRLGVPTLEPVYAAQRRRGGDWQTILVTLELTGYLPLKTLLDARKSLESALGREQRIRLLSAIAKMLRLMHAGRWVHNCLYPKHIFVHPQTLDVRLIDLEKMRRVATPRQAALRDLDTLNRRSTGWSRSERLRFLLVYLQRPRRDQDVARLWRQLRKLSRKSSGRQRAG